MEIIVLFILNKSMQEISIIYTLEDLSSTMQGSLDNRFVAFTWCIMVSDEKKANILFLIFLFEM